MVLYLLSGAIIGCIFIISINISIYELIYQHRSKELKNNIIFNSSSLSLETVVFTSSTRKLDGKEELHRVEAI